MPGNVLIDCFDEADILEAAKLVMERRVRSGPVFLTPSSVREFLRFFIGAEEREHFVVMFLDTQLSLIETVSMFSGTVAQTSVYPREVVKKALSLNSSAVVLCHNHPSGLLEPSSADKSITKMLVDALQMVDVRVVDHVIVSPRGTFSFTEKGLM